MTAYLINKNHGLLLCNNFGVLDESRTHDLCLRRATLYPPELRAQNKMALPKGFEPSA